MARPRANVGVICGLPSGSKFSALSLEVGRESGVGRAEELGVSLLWRTQGMKENSHRRKVRTVWELILRYPCS